MNKSLITVIIPVYNTANKIERCVNSVINQTYKNIEIILINDGSTDNSLEVCKNMAKFDDRIKIINITNQGVSVARNCGIEQANGEYVIFVDSDDYVEHTIIEKLYNKIVDTESDICQCSCSVANDDGKVLKVYDVPYQYTLTNKEEVINKLVLPLFGKKKCEPETIQGFCVCKLFKTSIVKNIKFNYNQRIYQDRCFCIDACLLADRISFLNESLYYYVINTNSSTQRCRDDLWIQCKVLIESLKNRTEHLPSNLINEINERIHITASTRLVFVTRHIFKRREKLSLFTAINQIKEMRENVMFDNGVANPNLGTMFSILSMLLRYRLYLPAVLIAKLAR